MTNLVNGGGGQSTIGFIGLGVMGEPICLNLIKKSHAKVLAFDLDAAPLERIQKAGGLIASSIAEVVAASDTIFCCLPSGAHVRSVVEDAGGIIHGVKPGTIVIDLGTSPVGLTREFAQRFAEKGAVFVDSPIARTRQAAIEGTLSVMVGASEDIFAKLEPLIRSFASDVTRCGDVGAGQVAKILNNMVLFQTVNALAEAVALGQRAGVEPKLLFETLAKGSADSFALRNHGMKAMIPRDFPLRAFSTEYALKDISYALDLAREVDLSMPGAELTSSVLQKAVGEGFGKAYWPVIAEVINRN
jgi:3-hydroxyisobutyrate dehydrogenase